jgi:NDP-sugar pyrophosphorylase family protein
VQVMVLGAGRGSRLATLDLGVPKILAPVAGEPLLARQLRYLLAEGADRVVVNAHHLADQVIAFAQAHPALDVVVEEELLGTAGGVRNALDRFAAGPIVVLYGDVIVDEPLAPLLAAHAGDATLTVYASSEVEGKGVIQVDGDRIVRFVEKGEEVAVPALINAGIYVVERELLETYVPAGSVSDFGHDVFPAALADGRDLRAYSLRKPVLDIGTPATFEQAQD